ncbi:hypothetical protein B0H11DRAFT_2190339 [Mycena galericulata]|nr:hypothetical protein B0H11DRAFT_2190339 [Mycena galericulata]
MSESIWELESAASNGGGTFRVSAGKEKGPTPRNRPPLHRTLARKQEIRCAPCEFQAARQPRFISRTACRPRPPRLYPALRPPRTLPAAIALVACLPSLFAIAVATPLTTLLPTRAPRPLNRAQPPRCRSRAARATATRHRRAQRRSVVSPGGGGRSKMCLPQCHMYVIEGDTCINCAAAAAAARSGVMPPILYLKLSPMSIELEVVNWEEHDSKDFVNSKVENSSTYANH